MALFSIVATPIGNMEDITLRAIRTLSEADMILAEDTRVTKKLLNRHNIVKPMMRYDAHSTDASRGRILELLSEGKNLALVTDAGTPGISDPGSYIVAEVREKLPDVRIDAIPGASAITTALSGCGFPSSEFVFLGFPPHKKGRKTFFDNLVDEARTIVFYESPHRMVKALLALQERMPERMMCVARELTKMHEEFIFGTASAILKQKDKWIGECVVVISSIKA